MDKWNDAVEKRIMPVFSFDHMSAENKFKLKLHFVKMMFRKNYLNSALNELEVGFNELSFWPNIS